MSQIIKNISSRINPTKITRSLSNPITQTIRNKSSHNYGRHRYNNFPFGPSIFNSGTGFGFPRNNIGSIFEEFDKIANSMMQLNNELINSFYMPEQQIQQPKLQGNTTNETTTQNTTEAKSTETASNTTAASTDNTSASTTSASATTSTPSENKETQLKTSEPKSSLGLSSLFNPITSFNQMKLDLTEESDKYIVTANIPDFNKDQLKLRLRNGVLTISGEIKEEKKDDTSYSSSVRSITKSIKLPNNIQQQGISAKYENGNLIIAIPKKEKTEVQGEQIAIQ